MHTQTWCLAVVLSLWLAKPGLGQPSTLLARIALRADVVGCYALYFESGRVDSSLYNATPSVRLESRAWRYDKGAPPARAARVLTGLTLDVRVNVPRRVSPPPHWSADSLTDSIRLSFVNGFSGAQFIFNAPPQKTDTLRGRVFESWDFGPPFQNDRGLTHAVREACPR